MPEMFSKAEARLNENIRHRKTRSDSTTVYPLTGLIRCPDCGKNIFGYTAPPRPRKNGKEGFYPRYISYRCISGRDRNGISCSLANKYYSGTKLEKEVRDVIASMVTIPEFVELVSRKVDCATDLSILRKKRDAIKAEYTVTHTHDGHTHSHTHGHDHEHGHQHSHSAAAPMDELLALMKYMVSHNDAHAQELAELADQLKDAGKIRAYQQIMDAVSNFDMVNAQLDAVLKELKVDEDVF